MRNKISALEVKTVFLSSNMDTIDEWIKRDTSHNYSSCYDLESLTEEIEQSKSYIVVADYDSVNSDINKLISSNTMLENLIVLERSPEIATGKMLISHGVKAYGNSRMLKIHYEQMLETVQNSKIWTYPELTASLVKSQNTSSLNENSKKLLENRLTPKEIEVVHLILEGLTNDAIGNALEITTRTVKAHISSIFQKLHINDRISLVLLLK